MNKVANARIVEPGEMKEKASLADLMPPNTSGITLKDIKSGKPVFETGFNSEVMEGDVMASAEIMDEQMIKKTVKNHDFRLYHGAKMEVGGKTTYVMDNVSAKYYLQEFDRIARDDPAYAESLLGAKAVIGSRMVDFAELVQMGEIPDVEPLTTEEAKKVVSLVKSIVKEHELPFKVNSDGSFKHTGEKGDKEEDALELYSLVHGTWSTLNYITRNKKPSYNEESGVVSDFTKVKEHETNKAIASLMAKNRLPFEYVVEKTDDGKDSKVGKWVYKGKSFKRDVEFARNVAKRYMRYCEDVDVNKYIEPEKEEKLELTEKQEEHVKKGYMKVTKKTVKELESVTLVSDRKKPLDEHWFSVKDGQDLSLSDKKMYERVSSSVKGGRIIDPAMASKYRNGVIMNGEDFKRYIAVKLLPAASGTWELTKKGRKIVEETPEMKEEIVNAVLSGKPPAIAHLVKKREAKKGDKLSEEVSDLIRGEAHKRLVRLVKRGFITTKENEIEVLELTEKGEAEVEKAKSKLGRSLKNDISAVSNQYAAIGIVATAIVASLATATIWNATHAPDEKTTKAADDDVDEEEHQAMYNGTEAVTINGNNVTGFDMQVNNTPFTIQAENFNVTTLGNDTAMMNAAMKEMASRHVNTVFTPLSEAPGMGNYSLDFAQQNDLKVIVNVSQAAADGNLSKIVQKYKNHPAVLGFAVSYDQIEAVDEINELSPEHMSVVMVENKKDIDFKPEIVKYSKLAEHDPDVVMVHKAAGDTSFSIADNASRSMNKPIITVTAPVEGEMYDAMNQTKNGKEAEVSLGTVLEGEITPEFGEKMIKTIPANWSYVPPQRVFVTDQDIIDTLNGLQENITAMYNDASKFYDEQKELVSASEKMWASANYTDKNVSQMTETFEDLQEYIDAEYYVNLTAMLGNASKHIDNAQSGSQNLTELAQDIDSVFDREALEEVNQTLGQLIEEARETQDAGKLVEIRQELAQLNDTVADIVDYSYMDKMRENVTSVRESITRANENITDLENYLQEVDANTNLTDEQKQAINTAINTTKTNLEEYLLQTNAVMEEIEDFEAKLTIDLDLIQNGLQRMEDIISAKVGPFNQQLFTEISDLQNDVEALNTTLNQQLSTFQTSLNEDLVNYEQDVTSMNENLTSIRDQIASWDENWTAYDAANAQMDMVLQDMAQIQNITSTLDNITADINKTIDSGVVANESAKIAAILTRIEAGNLTSAEIESIRENLTTVKNNLSSENIYDDMYVKQAVENVTKLWKVQEDLETRLHQLELYLATADKYVDPDTLQAVKDEMSALNSTIASMNTDIVDVNTTLAGIEASMENEVQGIRDDLNDIDGELSMYLDSIEATKCAVIDDFFAGPVGWDIAKSLSGNMTAEYESEANAHNGPYAMRFTYGQSEYVNTSDHVDARAVKRFATYGSDSGLNLSDWSSMLRMWVNCEYQENTTFYLVFYDVDKNRIDYKITPKVGEYGEIEVNLSSPSHYYGQPFDWSNVATLGIEARGENPGSELISGSIVVDNIRMYSE